MFLLSPPKILLILVVALVVLGPDKLPKVAGQIGSLWSDFRRFRASLESQVREAIPDLPSTDTVAQALRSPLSYLDTLADGADTGGAPDASQGQERAPAAVREGPPDSGQAAVPKDLLHSAETLAEVATENDPAVADHTIRFSDRVVFDESSVN